jgi:pyruvate dehydrogenase E2 component (dihydrolipoamide acetyltransferase)
MAKEIKMPQLSDTMDSGKILKWNKNVGDSVKRGEALAEVETDKANLEIEAFDAGVILEIKVPVNEVAKVGQIIAIIGAAGEQVASSASSAVTTSNTAQAKISETKVNFSPVTPESTITASLDNSSTQSNNTSQQVYIQNDDQRIVASPLAKKIAAQSNIDLRLVQGTGPHGRIIKKDVLSTDVKHANVTPTVTPTLSANTAVKVEAMVQTDSVQKNQSNIMPISTSPIVAGATSTPLSKMRQTIANRMQQAVAEIPHFYTTTSINMRQAKALRAICKDNQDFKSISINHLVMKAAAYALSKVPRVNCSYRDGQLYNPGVINIGIVTAVEDGLLIPVIKEVDRLNLKDLAFETKSAIDRARAGRPNGSDLSGGTFSISNMGMFDVENFTAIISPGQGAILAVSSVIDSAIVEAGTITIAPMMKVTLSVDHRIIDGSVSSAFLQEFKNALEQPALMLL